jgi:rod shape-determining protein MreC
MKKLFTRRLRTILAVALILALLTGGAAMLSRGQATPLQNAVGVILTPFRAGTAALTRQVERFYNYIYGYEQLEAENRVLQQRVAELERASNEIEEYRRENERLKELLNLTEEHEDYTLVAAYLLGGNGSNWGDTLTIGKGENAGIEQGMCALTEYGQVVGLVTETGENWATITTILDSASQISAVLATAGYTGVVQGNYQQGSDEVLRMNYLPTDSILKNGEQVLTAGSDRYPQGLVLGTVAGAAMDETGVAKYAVLEPAADFDSLEQVFILTDYTVS